jgi:hypothetical protein
MMPEPSKFVIAGFIAWLAFTAALTVGWWIVLARYAWALLR